MMCTASISPVGPVRLHLGMNAQLKWLLKHSWMLTSMCTHHNPCVHTLRKVRYYRACTDSQAVRAHGSQIHLCHNVGCGRMNSLILLTNSLCHNVGCGRRLRLACGATRPARHQGQQRRRRSCKSGLRLGRESTLQKYIRIRER